MIRKFGVVGGIANQPPGINVGMGAGNAQPGDVLAPMSATNDNGEFTGTLALTGDAAAANVLAGKTFYKDDAKTKLTGTMPDRAGDTAALSSSRSGTTLKLLASNGFRDGVDDNVTITDANFIAGNILSGVNLFGLLGTLKPQLQASGYLSSSSGTEQYKSGVYSYMVTSAALPFVPKMVIVFNVDVRNATFFFYNQLAYESGSFTTNSIMLGTSLSASNMQMFMTSTPEYSGGYTPYCNASGFKLPVLSPSTLYSYVAVGWS